MKKTVRSLGALWLLSLAILFGSFGVQAQDTWYLFDSYIEDGKPAATFTDVDADGNYVVEFSNHSDHDNFYITNTSTPFTEQEEYIYYGYTTDNIGCITVTDGMEKDLVNVGRDQVYSDKGGFKITAFVDTWIIKFNPNDPKVSFTKTAPDRLYFVDYTTNYGCAYKDSESACRVGEGIYRFENVKALSTPDGYDRSSYPFYGFCFFEDPQNNIVDWYITAVQDDEATGENNIDVIPEKTYTWAIAHTNLMDASKGSFVLGYGKTFDITLDYKAGTVIFTQKHEEAPETLWIGRGPDTYGSATKDENNTYTFKNVRLNNSENSYAFFNADNQGDSDMVIGGSLGVEDYNVLSGELVPMVYITKPNLNRKQGAYYISSGIYDIVVDWNTHTATFTESELEAPDELWLVDYRESFGHAVNNGDGIFTFVNANPDDSRYPYYGFANNSDPKNADVILSAARYDEASAANNIDIEKNTPYQLCKANWDQINDCIGSFVIPNNFYTITLDWNTKTVTFEGMSFENIALDADGNPCEEGTTLNIDEAETITVLVKPMNYLWVDNVTLAPVDESKGNSFNPEFEEKSANEDGYTPIVITIPLKIRGTGEWKASLDLRNVYEDLDGEVATTFVTDVHPAAVIESEAALQDSTIEGEEPQTISYATISWTHPLVYSVAVDGGDLDIEFTSASGNKVTGTLSAPMTYAASPSLIVNFGDTSKAKKGTYTGTIPAGAIHLNEDAETNSPAIPLTYEVNNTTGVDSVIGDLDEEVYVYSLQGVLLRHGKAADVLRNLDKDIYVINGKKVDLR